MFTRILHLCRLQIEKKKKRASAESNPKLVCRLYKMKTSRFVRLIITQSAVAFFPRKVYHRIVVTGKWLPPNSHQPYDLELENSCCRANIMHRIHLPIAIAGTYLYATSNQQFYTTN